MRKPVLLIFTNALILIAIFTLLAQSLFVVQRLAQAQDVHGSVLVQRQGAGEFTPLAANATVSVGDVVRTGSDGEVTFAWADQTRWRLVPGTMLTIQKATQDAAKHIETSSFRLDAGKVLVRVAKQLAPGSKFEVETPNAIANAAGAVFSVAVMRCETKVEVWKGQLALFDGSGDRDVVEAGQQATAGNGSVLVSQLPPEVLVGAQAPATLLRPSLKFVVQTTRGKRAMLRGNTEAGDVVRVNGDVVPVLGNGVFFKPVKLVPGHNEWRVQSIDAQGGSSVLCRAIEFDAANGDAKESFCHTK